MGDFCQLRLRSITTTRKRGTTIEGWWIITIRRD
nr:MAG TPA: hypothetical protein [Caudoviricetes sp.]